MDKQQAYYNLWSRFLPAYDENRVPEDAVYPYITYQVLLDDIDAPVYPTATLWDKSTSWTYLDSKLNEISSTIEDIMCIKLDEGFMYIRKGTPWGQRTSDPNDKTVIGYLLNLSIEFLTEK